MQPEEFIGLDIGGKHIGIARGNSVARLAEPLATVGAAEAIDELKMLCSKHNPTAIVAGLPRNLDSQDTKQTTAIRSWVEQAKTELNLPFYWQDEALTSHQAAQHQSGRFDEHALAAAVILQDFLNSEVDDRMVA